MRLKHFLSAAIGLCLIAVISMIAFPEITQAVREKIGIDSRDDCYIYDGSGLYFYSDDHSTNTISLDGSASATATPMFKIAPPTAQAGNIVDIRNAQSTPVLQISSAGTFSYYSFPAISAPHKIAVPPAQATATPGFQIDSLAADGDSVMVSQAATRVAGIDRDGNLDTNGFILVGQPTPAIVTPAAGDAVIKDDVEIQGDLDVALTGEIDGGITVDDTNFTVSGSTGAVTTASTLGVTGLSTLTGGASIPLNATGNLRVPIIASKAISYTAAAGATYTGFVIPAGQIVIVHSVLANVTVNWDATGDDATLTVGDASDADGFLTLADTELQAADTEATGFAAGWQGQADATIGVYLDEVDSGFVVVAPTGGYTVTFTTDETSGDTLSAGEATLYLTYTRLQ